MGLMQLFLAGAVVMGGLFLKVQIPVLIFIIVGCVFTGLSVYAVGAAQLPSTGLEKFASRSDQYKIMINALLTFLYRNGYPLVFGVFISAQHIGYFRLEERLAFTVSFIPLLVETVAMKDLIHGVKIYTGAKLLKLFAKYFFIALIPTIVAAASIAYAVSTPIITRKLNISPDTEWRYAVYLAAPLFTFIQFSTLLLNLKGYFRTIALNMVIVFSVFFATSYFLYASNGLGGVRLAYLIAAILSAFWVGFATLYSVGITSQDTQNPNN